MALWPAWFGVVPCWPRCDEWRPWGKSLAIEYWLGCKKGNPTIPAIAAAGAKERGESLRQRNDPPPQKSLALSDTISYAYWYNVGTNYHWNLWGLARCWAWSWLSTTNDALSGCNVLPGSVRRDPASEHWCNQFVWLCLKKKMDYFSTVKSTKRTEFGPFPLLFFGNVPWTIIRRVPGEGGRK